MKTPKIVLLLIPGVIFLLALSVFIAKLPKATPNQTENTVVLTPTPIPTIEPMTQTPLQDFVQSVDALQINDPQLTPPNFDRKISLPAEK